MISQSAKNEKTQSFNSFVSHNALARLDKKTISVAIEILVGTLGGSLFLYYCSLHGIGTSGLLMIGGAEIAGMCGVVLATRHYLKQPTVEELFNALPKSWNDETPGLFLDRTPRTTAAFEDSRPDITCFPFNSVFLHVFYSVKSKSLWFKVYIIDNDGFLIMAQAYRFEKNLFIHPFNRNVTYGSLDSLLKHHSEGIGETGPLQRAERILEIDVPDDIKNHFAYQGCHQNNVLYQKSSAMEYAIIYSIDHKSLLLITNLATVTFTYNKETLQYECTSLCVKSSSLQEFIGSILLKCKTPEDSSSSISSALDTVIHQIKPTFLAPKNDTAHLETLFASLPPSWNANTPGLLLDKTARDMREYYNGNSYPDVSGYKYNSILLHVFYSSGSKSLQFCICEIDEKGNMTQKEWCSFKDNLLYNAKKEAFFSIEGLINFYVPHYRKPARLATRIKTVPQCHPILIHPAYQGAHHSATTYQKPSNLDFTIIYSLDYESFMIVVDGAHSMSFSYDEHFHFFSEHMSPTRYSLSDFLSEAYQFLKRQTDPDLLQFIAKPTGKPNMPTHAELEKFFQDLPEAWNQEQPGLILDKTIRQTPAYLNGQDRPDLTQYAYDSIFIHVFYGWGERALSFHLCILDKNGVIKPVTRLSWENDGVVSSSYPGLCFKTPKEFIDHHQKRQLHKYGLTRRIAPTPNVLNDQIAKHKNYIGECRDYDAESQNGTFCIAYSIDHGSFFVNAEGRILPIEYDPATRLFRHKPLAFEDTSLDSLISRILKYYKISI